MKTLHTLSLGLATVILLSGCVAEVEKERLIGVKDRELIRQTDLKKDIARTKEKLEGVKERYEKAAVMVQAAQKLIDDRRVAHEQIEQIEERLKEATVLLEAYQKAFREPQAVFTPGQNLGDVQLKNGFALRGAVVTQGNARQVVLRHLGGIGTYPLELLPDSLLVNVPMRPVFEVSAVEINPMEVLKKRPNSLKTYDQRSREQLEALKDERAQALAKSEAREKSREEARTKREAEMAAKQAEALAAREEKDAANEKTKQEILALTTQLRKLEDQILAYESAKTAQLSKWAGMSVKPSAVQQQKDLAAFDAQIANLRRSIASIDAQILKLQQSIVF